MSNKHLVKQLLMADNFWVLNKKIVKLFGLETAFLLSNFAEAETMLADKEGWFYQTSEMVENITTLSRHKQDQCIKELEEMGVLKKKLKGLPAKRYFKLDYECLTTKIVNNQQTRLLEISKLDCKKSATSKELSNKELSNKELTIKDIVVSKEIDHVPYKEVFDYFKEKTGKTIRMVESNKKLVRARFNQGFTLTDFKHVIDVKTQQWLGDKEMEKYLRAITLFGTKFESYSNEKLEVVKEERDYGGMKTVKVKSEPISRAELDKIFGKN